MSKGFDFVMTCGNCRDFEYAQRFNYKIYRWIWVTSGSVSRWAGKQLTKIDADYATKKREEEAK